MGKPNCADDKPVVLELAEGTYYYCTCGYSTNQPFCDGSHQPTEFTPIRFKVEKVEKRKYCLCKNSRTPPYCDGAHREV